MHYNFGGSRSSSSLKSPNKPAVPPKPRNISNKSTPSPKKSSLDLNGTSFKSSKCNNNGDNSSKMQLKISSKSSDKNKNGIHKGSDIQTEKGKRILLLINFCCFKKKIVVLCNSSIFVFQCYPLCLF